MSETKLKLTKDEFSSLLVADRPMSLDPSCRHFFIKTNSGAFDYSADAEYYKAGRDLTALYQLPGAIELRITWRETTFGLTTRKDVILNLGAEPVVIYGYNALTRMEGIFRLYSQSNFWTRENQGRWEPLTHGAREFTATGTRIDGVTPYLALHDTVTGRGMAVHLLQNGDWSMRVEARQDSVTLSTGPENGNLAYALEPGEELLISNVLFQPLAEAMPESGAAPLHRYLLNRAGGRTEKKIPVEYNTWFFDFQNLNEEALLQQLDAAAALGCEAFVVDAGWYGQSEGNWHEQVGDWREKQDGAFYGKMAAFAEKVRVKGLVFGVWMEPERFGKNVSVVLEHPDWFYPDADGFLCPDLDRPEVSEYMFNEIAGVIDRYSAGWLKIDTNHNFGRDPNGKAHTGYIRRFREITDRLREKYPALILESCASGGLRYDIETQSHFDISFFSDNVNPYYVLRIAEGAALRSLPSRTMRWCCFRNGGKVPAYLLPNGRNAVLTPRGALWDEAERIDADFALKVCLQGHLSFSGELAALDEDTKKKIQKAVCFTKKYQSLVQNGVTHLLTAVAGMENRSGWSAAFVHDETADRGVLYAYRLDSPAREMTFRLPLTGQASYRLEDYDTGESFLVNAESLREKGLSVQISERLRGRVLICEPGELQ